VASNSQNVAVTMYTANRLASERSVQNTRRTRSAGPVGYAAANGHRAA
jgi:hypothetical protein